MLHIWKYNKRMTKKITEPYISIIIIIISGQPWFPFTSLNKSWLTLPQGIKPNITPWVSFIYAYNWRDNTTQQHICLWPYPQEDIPACSQIWNSETACLNFFFCPLLEMIAWITCLYCKQNRHCASSVFFCCADSRTMTEWVHANRKINMLCSAEVLWLVFFQMQTMKR